jgi:acetyltransferase
MLFTSLNNKTSLEFLFNPKSIAIVGVSEDPTKLGSVLLSNLVDAKYEGKIYPVNPKHTQLYGFKTYSSVSQIPEVVDLVCIVVPAQFVKDILEDSGKKGVQGAVIISAGFSELGNEGAKIEEELYQISQKYNIRILGPNCLGAIVPSNNINVSFAASRPADGNIAFFSQSGAFCTAMLDMSLEKNVGFSHFISFGNKVDINENDLIKDWLNDDRVKVIGGYIEEIESGHKMIDIYQASETRKPLVLFKPGDSQEAQKAISSHTGSLAGSMQTFRTAMEQSGIILATEVNQMFNLMMSFSWSKIPKGNRVAIVTNAGGPGIIATDAIVRKGLKMAEISEDSKQAIKSFLPPTASVINPVDVIGDALAERYRAPIDILIKDDNVDCILVILTPQLVTQIEDTAKLIINTAKLSKKPIYTVFLGGKYVSFGLQRLYDEKIPAFRYIDEAVDVISSMYKYQQYGDSNKDTEIQNNLLNSNLAKGKYSSQIKQLLADEVVALPEDLAVKLVDEVGIVLPKQIVTSSINEAIDFAKDYYPVVLKATTEIIAHKTDQKALYLNIKNEEELRSSFEELITMIRSTFNVENPEILIQEMIMADEEIFIGANRDGTSNVYENNQPGFGHLLAFGKGGIYTEVYKDIAYSLVPAKRTDIESALTGTKVFQIINGARGKEKLAMDKLVDMIESIQELVLLYPEIESLDINPVLLTKDRAVCVDLKVFIKN